jgi:hypothetical protein
LYSAPQTTTENSAAINIKMLLQTSNWLCEINEKVDGIDQLEAG